MYHTKYHNQELNKLSFLITGGAGFIGSNIVEYLLKYGARKVRVLDNFSTGFFKNIEKFTNDPAFELVEGDIRDIEICKKVLNEIDYVSHQAALGSIPRSINDPITTNAVNISGFLNLLCAVKEQSSVKRMVYAASSSTYGDSTQLPKVENCIGKPLSPYAVTKYVNELYADVFSKTFDMKLIGLRYFNVFGPNQSADGEYAAVIPILINAVLNNQPVTIHGDGEQTRDFTFVENAVQANIKAFFSDNDDALNQVYNVAFGKTTSLNTLLAKINNILKTDVRPVYKNSRQGDIKNSWADITKAKTFLDYNPKIDLDNGINITIQSYR